jgi:hypothetical protein
VVGIDLLMSTATAGHFRRSILKQKHKKR